MKRDALGFAHRGYSTSPCHTELCSMAGEIAVRGRVRSGLLEGQGCVVGRSWEAMIICIHLQLTWHHPHTDWTGRPRATRGGDRTATSSASSDW